MFILYLCITIVLALFMAYMILWYKQKKDLSSLTSETDGEIVKVVKRDYKDPDSGDNKTACTLKVAYSVNGISARKELVTFILIIGKTGFDLIWDIIEMLIKQ